MEQSTKLYIHYDIKDGKHYIPVEQSIATEQAIKVIAKTLWNRLFEWDLDVKVFVEAKDEWWVVIQFLLWWILGTTAISSNALLKHLTWKNYKEHVENITINLALAIQKFLSEESTSLVEAWFCREKFLDAYEVKNNLYRTANFNPDILWLGFCKEHKFPIQKDDFLPRVIDLQKNIEKVEHIDKFHDILVVKPVNHKSEKHLQWDLKDIKWGKVCKAWIWDETFYDMHLDSPQKVDKFKARVRYYISMNWLGVKKIEKREVVMVYEYNNSKKLMTLPEDAVFVDYPYLLEDVIIEETNQIDMWF